MDEDGWLANLCDELQRPSIQFNMDSIRVVPGADGNEVEDARSKADHEALADFITAEVRNLTADDNVAIHASIAGGRKTMTFYLGYAMSLFGRPQDSLSHVLVSDGYENLPGFFFPTRQSVPLLTHAQKPALDTKGKQLDARDAEVTLADIPFIRHRASLPRVMRELGGALSFRKLVQLINMANEPDKLRLTIYPKEMRLEVGTHDAPTFVKIDDFGLLDMAFYLMIAEATRDGDSEFPRPKSSQRDRPLASLLLSTALDIVQLVAGDGIENKIEALLDWDLEQPRRLLNRKSLDALIKGMTDAGFSTHLSRISAKLNECLPDGLANFFTPQQIWARDKSRLKDSGKAKGGGYGLPLPDPEHQIRICDG